MTTTSSVNTVNGAIITKDDPNNGVISSAVAMGTSFGFSFSGTGVGPASGVNGAFLGLGFDTQTPDFSYIPLGP